MPYGGGGHKGKDQKKHLKAKSGISGEQKWGSLFFMSLVILFEFSS